MLGTLDLSRADWPYGRDEILVDGVIHALGLALSLAGVAVLLGLERRGETAGVAADAVYCAGLLGMLGVSAAYNLWPLRPVKWVLRRVDHAMIFVMIAATYTPFMLRVGTPGCLALLAGVWATSLAGVAMKLAGRGRREKLFTALYLALGWSGLLAIRSLADTIPPACLMLILLGGLLYSVGALFHHWRSLKFQNAIWHGFVLAGAGAHYGAVLTMAGAA